MSQTEQNALFPRDVPIGAFASFRAAGFPQPVSGIVFEGGTTAGGVPLGGLGTGYLDVNSDGTFGRCSIFNNICPPRNLNTPHLGVSANGRVCVLTTRPPAEALGVQRIRYWGHFPVADVEYDVAGPVQVSVRAWTPFVLGDADASNTPAAVFDVVLGNVGGSPVSGRLAFTFPGPDLEPQGRVSVGGALRGVYVRHGRGAGYCLAVVGSAPVEVCAPLGTDARPWAELDHFADPDAKTSGTALTVPYSLAAGEQTALRVVLSWFYPYFKDSGGEPHVHHYIRHFRSAVEVAQRIAADGDDLLRRTLAWQQVIYSSEEPDWLQDALVNSLYSLAKNTLWVVSDRPDNWYADVGFFTHSESFTGCPITETMVCRQHGHFPALFFFPELERSTLWAFQHFQLRDGEVPFSFGAPTSLRDPRYHCQHPLNSGQYTQMVNRYFQRTGDRAFLREFATSARDAVQYQKSLDYDHDGLVNDHSHANPGEFWPANQFYDIWPWYGTSAYVAGTWLGTLVNGMALAEAAGDAAWLADLTTWLARAVQAYDEKLWTGTHYRLYNDPENARRDDTSLGNQLVGDWCARIVGAPSPLSHERIQAALDTVERLNFAATAHGLVNGVHLDGTRHDTGIGGRNDHGKQVFVGENLCAAMTFLYNGRMERGMEIARRLYEAIAVLHRTPWNQHCLISADDGSPVWGSDYYSDMAFWAVPMARRGMDIRAFVAQGGLVDRILAAGSR